MATSLGTTTSGTAWYTNTYPMANTLNSYANTTWYVAASAPNVNTLKNDVVTDISNDHVLQQTSTLQVWPQQDQQAILSGLSNTGSLFTDMSAAEAR